MNFSDTFLLHIYLANISFACSLTGLTWLVIKGYSWILTHQLDGQLCSDRPCNSDVDLSICSLLLLRKRCSIIKERAEIYFKARSDVVAVAPLKVIH